MLRTCSIFALFLLAAGCGGSSTEESPAGDDRAVLEVEGETVTAGELAGMLENFRGDSVMVERRVNNLVNRLLILENARARGLDTTREFELYAWEREREKIQTVWLQWILDRKVPLPPDTVENFYSRMGENVLYTVISVNDRALSDSLRRLVLQGEDMNLLAQEFSTNRVEAARQGVVGPLDRMQVAPVDARLLEGLQPGEVSPVDSSRKGWTFLRVDSLFHYTPPPLDELREILGARIRSRLQMEYKEVLFDSLRTFYDLRVEEGIPRLMASHFPEGSLEYEPFTPEEEEMQAYSYEGGGRTVYQLAENIRNLPPAPDTDPSDPQWIERYAGLIGLYDILAVEARKQGMDTLPETVNYLRPRLNDHLLDIYYAEVIQPRLVSSEEEMMEVFQAHRDSLVVPETRVFHSLSAVGDQQLQLLDSIMERDIDPFGLTEEFTPVQSLLAPGEETLTRPIYSSEIPQPYRDIMFGADMEETVTCSVSADRVLVLKTVEINPERPATFEESQDEIAAVLRTEKEEEVLSALVDSLASVYHIEVDRDFIEGFIPEEPSSPDSSQAD